MAALTKQIERKMSKSDLALASVAPLQSTIDLVVAGLRAAAREAADASKSLRPSALTPPTGATSAPLRPQSAATRFRRSRRPWRSTSPTSRPAAAGCRRLRAASPRAASFTKPRASIRRRRTASCATSSAGIAASSASPNTRRPRSCAIHFQSS